jgi:hypothetical protein
MTLYTGVCRQCGRAVALSSMHISHRKQSHQHTFTNDGPPAVRRYCRCGQTVFCRPECGGITPHRPNWLVDPDNSLVATFDGGVTADV